MEANYMRITSYNCEVCHRMHNEDDKDGLFSEHFAENFQSPRLLTNEELKEVWEAMKAEDKAKLEEGSEVKDKNITLKTDIIWMNTTLLREWPTKNGRLLLLRTPETYTVMDPDGKGLIFNNEQDAIKVYEAKVKGEEVLVVEENGGK